MGEKPPGAEKKTMVLILGILLGSIGAHKFYLGRTTPGLIQIGLTLITCGLGAWVGIIEAVMIFLKSDEDFVAQYIEGDQQWF